MDPALILAALAGAAAAPSGDALPGPPTWRIERNENYCGMGTAFANGTTLRLEYHPRTDDYFLLVGGTAVRDVADGQKVKLEIGSSNFARAYPGKGIKQDSDLPSAVFAHMARMRIIVPGQRARKTSDDIEGILTTSGDLVIDIDGRRAVHLSDRQSGPALVELARCSNQFAGESGKSRAWYRIVRERGAEGAR